jgi:hypothetical protein
LSAIVPSTIPSYSIVADSSTATGLVWKVDPVADLVTTAGDTLYATAADTLVRLGIGTAGQVLQVNSGATAPEWATPAGGGKVLQVVAATYSTQTLIASTSFTDTGLSLSITPTLATSKVLVLAVQNIYVSRNSQSNGAALQLVRGATVIQAQATTYQSLYMVPTGVPSMEIMTMIPLNHLDSPATTSSTTYKIQARSQNTANSGQVVANVTDSISTIILLEIGA